MTEEKKLVAAYVPFKTFLAAIEGFERNMPDPIDTSVWPTYSGAIKSQLLMAFKFLGLIDEKGHISTTLRTLVDDKENRKANLRKVLESAYKPIFALKLNSTSPMQFQKAMESVYGKTGETQTKIKSFFLQAAKYAAVPMNQLLLTRTRNIGPRKKKRDAATNAPETSMLPTPPQHGNAKTIQLKSGGTLALAFSGNVLDLSASDRQFVFGLNDQLEEYESKPEKK